MDSAGGVDGIEAAREGMLYIPVGDTPATFTAMSEWTGRDEFIPPDNYIIGPYCTEADLPDPANSYYPAMPIIDTNIYTKSFRLKLTPPK